MMLIGVDPHKATHTAVAVDDHEQPIARLLVASDRRQVPRLLAWAETLDAERLWAVESANGLGRLLSQQLVAAGEQVVGVPATLAARVRLFGPTKAAKNDPNDALSTAIAGCGTTSCAPSGSRTTPRCSGCCRTVTATWVRCGPRRSAGSMSCCPS